MANHGTNVQKREERTPAGLERTRTRPVYQPRCDIYEREGGVVVVAEIPGVNETSVDVGLEDGVLTISGQLSEDGFPGHELSYEEYRVGDYRRSFTLSDEIDTSKINASMKDGVLRLFLPKVEAARPRRIAVKAG